jgi:hypothetical protein
LPIPTAIVSPLSDSKIPGCPELDTETDGIITNASPVSDVASYLDLIRNEKTDIFYQIGRAFLFAKLRRAGQGTSNLAAAAVRTVAGAPWLSAQAYQRVR